MASLESSLSATVLSTPFGPLAIIATPEDGVIRASGFCSLAATARQLPRHLALRGWVEAPLPHVAHAVEAWLGGDGSALGRVLAQQEGTPFMQAVWAEMREIPAGEVATYGELAELAGRPRAARAVGTVCARNALAPFVPCHRVVASHGLGNYGYGIGVKKQMLELEGAAGSRF